MRDTKEHVQEGPSLHIALGSWTLRIEVIGGDVTQQGGVLEDDEFVAIIGNGLSSINLSVGMNFPFGDAKVSVSVRLSCNQDETTIDRASALAMTKAMTLCKDGLVYAIEERNQIVTKMTTG